MQKKSLTVFIFSILFFVALLLMILGKLSFLSGGNSVITFFTRPLQQSTFSLFHMNNESETVEQLRADNAVLLKKLVDQKKLLAENNALRDQFQVNKPANVTLVPAVVIGAPGFLPGVSLPDALILNVGKESGVKKGEAVLVNNNLVGSIERASYSQSIVTPLRLLKQPFTGRTLETNATGLIMNTDTGLQLQNVVLSEELKKGDLVVTKGDVNKEGVGFLPDIVIGKIVSVDKKPSALFQSAKIQTLIDVANVRIVFIARF